MSNKFRICVEEIEEQPIDPRSQIEIEEEHQRIAIELDDGTDEINRQSELVEGLESLQYIASKLDLPTPTEVALFRVAANMAVIGTEKSAQDFLPAMESYKPIALEGFGEHIMDFIKAIIAKLKEWWDKFVEWVKGLFTKEEKVKKEIKATQEKIDDAVKNKRKPKSEKIVLTNKSSDLNDISGLKKNKKEDDTLKIHLSNQLISKSDLRDKVVNLSTINFCIDQIDTLSSFTMNTVVPEIIKHVEKYIALYKERTFGPSKEFDDEFKERKELIKKLITVNGKYLFKATDSSLEKYDMSPNFSCIFSSLIRLDGFTPLKVFKGFLGNNTTTEVECEVRTNDINELKKSFNSDDIKSIDIKTYNIIKNNERKIEKLNEEIKNYCLKTLQLNKDRNVELFIEYDAQKVTDLSSLLNSVQKYSIDVRDFYIESLHKKLKVYNKIVVYYI